MFLVVGDWEEGRCAMAPPSFCLDTKLKKIQIKTSLVELANFLKNWKTDRSWKQPSISWAYFEV